MTYQEAKNLCEGDKVIAKETGEVLKIATLTDDSSCKAVFIKCNNSRTYHHAAVQLYEEKTEEKAKPVITKKEFVGYIEKIKSVFDFHYALHKFYRSYGASEPYDMPDCVDTAIDILDNIFSPITHDVEKFCLEWDFGKEFEIGYITTESGDALDLSTAEKLYDYLVSEQNDWQRKG